MNSQSISTQDLAVRLAAMASQTRCRDVVVLDMRGRSPVTEFFVLATGTSDRQMRAVADELADHGAQCGFKPFRRSGDDSANWILLDFVGVVAHIFNESSRAFYDLETLWDGCPRVNWQLLAEPADQVTADIDTQPTPVTMPTASVVATTDAAASAKQTPQDQPTSAPKAPEIFEAEVIAETDTELVAQVDAVPAPADQPASPRPRPKRRSVAAKPAKKTRAKTKPRPTKPSLTKATRKAKDKVRPAKPALRKTGPSAKTRRTSPKGRPKTATAARPATASKPRTAKRPTAVKKPKALRRKSR